MIAKLARIYKILSPRKMCSELGEISIKPLPLSSYVMNIMDIIGTNHTANFFHELNVLGSAKRVRKTIERAPIP